jgi:hypothetical protein
MHGTVIPNAKRVSVNPDTKTVSLGAAADTSDNDVGNAWFSDAMRDLGINAEMLVVLTRSDMDKLRTCYRYLTSMEKGGTKPTGYFILMLLASEAGQQILDRLFEGRDVPWWREHQRALRIAAQVDKMDLS